MLKWRCHNILMNCYDVRFSCDCLNHLFFGMFINREQVQPGGVSRSEEPRGERER